MKNIGLGVIAGKLQRRLWSSHTTIAVVRDLTGTESTPAADGLRVGFEDPATFDTLPRLLAAASGMDYLQLRAVEHTREARSGSLSVARDAAGDVVAFGFVHDSGDREALERVSPGMYPRLSDEDVLTRVVYCLPEWRGRSIEAQTLIATGTLMAERGKKRGWAYLDTGSADVMRIFREAGYAPSGDERVDSYRLGRYSNAFRPITPPTRAAWG